MMVSLSENARSRDSSVEGLIHKKVHFRDKDENLGSDMLVDLTVEQTTSWKDKLVGHSSNVAGNGPEEKEDFDLVDGGIQKSIVNDIPSIEFSDRIHQILIRDMDNIVILKLLGHNIGLPGLQSYMYKRKILVEIAGMIGNVAKQKWLYGHMKEACIFRVSESSTRKESPSSKTLSENQSMVMNDKGEKCETYGPWMLVEKKSRRKSKDPSQMNAGNPTKKKEGSRFRALNDLQ
ncbi:hypothetical protein Gohar_027201 [Gossypium harknessii]|uniref:Uncharacterized protein n=1 Tax=Gossypium harknessii TaxID=34285 RepID=A0A7J9HU28_9ROSI|nr:hypothetical protein [Gossypium harknessii]